MKTFDILTDAATKKSASKSTVLVRTILRTAILVSLLSCAASSAFCQAVGDLMVLPTRVVFSDKQRSAELTLINTGKKAATYRISFIHLRMDEVGSLGPVTTQIPGEQFADDLVRFSPRQIVLEPRVSQTVRLQLRKPADLAHGEYRSHLQFRAIDNESSSVDDPEPATGLDIRLKPVYGVSIAVVVRNGELESSTTVSDIQLQPATDKSLPKLQAKFNRVGNASVYGDVEVSFSPKSGKSQVIGNLNGVAVYTPNPDRLVLVPLQLPDGLVLEKGQISIVYKQKTDDGGATLASGTLELP